MRRLISRVALRVRYWFRRLRAPEVIACDGIRLPLVAGECSAAMLEELYMERYEEDEAAIVRAVLRPDDTVLELGAGIGFISAVCAKLGAAVHCVEANPHLIPIAKRTFELNRVTADLRHAAIAPSHGTVELFLADEFWTSSTLPEADAAARSVKVPGVRLDELLAEIRPSVLICDVEGAEAQVFDGVDLSSVRNAVVEVHPKLIGWDGVRRLIRTLFDADFTVDTRLSIKNVLLFRREPATATR